MLEYERVARTGKFVTQPFQEVDLQQLTEGNYSANWSEMGCYKTTTAEDLILRKLEHVQNPRVLIVTTKSGKGAYYETLHEKLPDWEIYTVGSTQFNMVINGMPVPFDVELPYPTDEKKVVVVAHYHCFTDRACKIQPVRDPKWELDSTGAKIPGPVKKDEDGNPVVKIPRCKELVDTYWDMMILDEAHRIKNPDAQWSRNIVGMSKQVFFKHIMTGTGFINDPSEIHNLLFFLGGRNLVPTRNKFKDEFCKMVNKGGFWVVEGIKPGMKEAFIDLTRKVGVRRTLKETHPNIMEPLFTKIPVDLNPTQRKMYDELVEMLSTLDAQGVPLHAANILSLLNRLRQVCVATPRVVREYPDPETGHRRVEIELVEPSSKLDALMEIIDGLEWDDDPDGVRQQLVVFSNFKDPLELLKVRLDKAKVPYIHMEAKDSESIRYHKWKVLWPQKKHQVFMCTVQLGGESINLSSAERAVFLDRSWSPKDNLQAVGRVYRPGQTGAAQIINIEASGTVDQYIESKLTKKIGWFKAIFNPDSEDNDAS